ncbi:MAG: type IV secretion protein IcmD [Gammaproteobacteria bacterium]
MYTLLRKRIPLKHVYATISGVLLFAGSAMIAAHADTTLADLAKNVQTNLGPVETLIIALCYIGGVGFAGAAIMKFKQYKDNPQQIQLGQPIALTFIAAALIWLPQLVKTAGATIFGAGATPGGTEQSGGIFQ